MKFYGAVAASGGGQGAMDDIDGSVVADGEACLVIPPGSSRFEVYTLDGDSGLAEADGIVAPDANAGDKRWIRRNLKNHANGLHAEESDDSTEWDGATKTVSTGAPSGGSDGDIHFQYVA